MWLAQISDMHVTAEGCGTPYTGDTGPMLARCVHDICGIDEPPAAVMASGDLTNEGTPEEYARLRELLGAVHVPLYVIPGNHDRREAVRSAFAGDGYLPASGALRYTVPCGELRLIALDTLVEGEDGGSLDALQLDWLADTLKRYSAPTIIVLHHPPCRTGIAGMDRIALDDASADALGELVRRNPHIARIVCGHVHRDLHASWCGRTVSVCPSTAFQTSLSFEGAPFAADPSQPAAYFAHHWNGSELVTHTVNVPGA